MNAVTTWILSIFAVIVVGVVVDLLFSGSRMAKTIKTVTATVTLLIMIAPIPVILKNGFTLKNGDITEFKLKTDENYLEYVNEKKLNVLERGAEKRLEEGGIRGAKVEIRATNESEEIKIVQVIINLSESVIDGNNEHINKNELAVELVSGFLNVGKGEISVYE